VQKPGAKTMLADLSEIIWPAIYLLGSLSYCVFLQMLARLEYRYKNKKDLLSEQVCVEKLARIYGISEYAIFCKAADKWHISEKKTEAAFRTYLKCGDIPHYVRDLVRNHKNEIAKHDTPNFPSSSVIP
jgi:hypothetical protein